MKRVRVKPGKGQAMAGLIGGALFCLIGLFFVIPTFGFFGIIWTAFAAIITVTHAVNVFSDKGVATHEIVIDDDSVVEAVSASDVKSRLETLRQLYNDGTISEEEYEVKRKKILDEI